VTEGDITAGLSRDIFSAAQCLPSISAARRNCLAAAPSGSRNSTSLVETRDDAVSARKLRSVVFGGESQIAERIHEEGGAAADFVAKHGRRPAAP